MVRRFQFGALSPLMRLHGFRDPGMPPGPEMTGGPNEVWSYGEEAGAILERVRSRPTRRRGPAPEGIGAGPLRGAYLKMVPISQRWSEGSLRERGP